MRTVRESCHAHGRGRERQVCPAAGSLPPCGKHAGRDRPPAIGRPVTPADNFPEKTPENTAHNSGGPCPEALEIATESLLVWRHDLHRQAEVSPPHPAEERTRLHPSRLRGVDLDPV